MRCLALAVIAACGGTPGAGGGGGGDDAPGTDAKQPDGPGGGTSGPAAVFDPAITSVHIEIDYETGKAPYTGPIVGFGDTFDV